MTFLVEPLVRFLPVVYMFLGLGLLPDAWGLQCDICDRSLCPARQQADCPAGVVLDACQCCYVCARVVNETCGGKFDIQGRCADGLACRIAPAVGTPVGSEDHVGICKPDSADVDCDKAKCDVVFAPKCPADSIAIQSASHKDKCCPGPYKCQCKSCLSAQLTACGIHQLAVIVSTGSGKPGQCCNIYECADKDTACNGVVCDGDMYAAAHRCPSDSYPLPPLHTNNGCCERHQGCVCYPKESCEHVTCGPDQRLRVIEPATGYPGSCCDEVHCVNKTGLTCNHDAVVRQDSESWHINACTTCACKDGLTFCKAASCNEPVHCSWMGVPKGECCPVCKGCIADDGESYKNGESWASRDSCVTCHCDEGRVYCQAEMCVIRCMHPRKMPGICCPVCDEETMVTVPPYCPPVNDCSLLCPNGRVRDDDGCYECRCNPETDIATEIPSTPQSSTDVSEHGRRCLSLEGMRMHDGDSWYDGCRRCFCHHGREMCALITCPALKCHNPVMRVGDCCPSCGVEEPPSSSTTSKCRRVDGSHVTDGDTWTMDECTLCICHDGGVLCEIDSCPPVLCHRPVKRPGHCCLTCPDGNELLPPPPGRTRKNHCESAVSVFYSSGDTWRVNACQSCVCQDGQIHCFSQSCPLLSCDETQLKKGQCCPQCPDAAESHRTNFSQSETPSVVVIQRTNNKGDGYGHKGYQASIGVLSLFVVLLLLLVLLLVFLLLRRQRRWRSRNRGRAQLAEVCGIDGKCSKRRPKSTNLDFQGINPLGKKSTPMYTKVYMDGNFRLHMGEETINPLGSAMCGDSMVTGICHNVAMDEMNIPCHSDNDLNVPLDVTMTTDEDCHDDVMTDDTGSCHSYVTEKQNICDGVVTDDDALPVCRNTDCMGSASYNCDGGDTKGDAESDTLLARAYVVDGDSRCDDERPTSLLVDIPSVCDRENYRRSV